MRIAIDVDEVLADQLSGLIAFHNAEYGTTLQRGDFATYRFWETWGGTREEAIEKTRAFHQSSAAAHIAPVVGAQDAVQKLSRQHELIVVTARWNDIAAETQQWIAEYFPQAFSQFHFANHYALDGSPERTKLEICQEIGADLLIDDSLSNVTDMAYAGKRGILLDYPWNQSDELPQGVLRARSWSEVLRSI